MPPALWGALCWVGGDLSGRTGSTPCRRCCEHNQLKPLCTSRSPSFTLPMSTWIVAARRWDADGSFRNRAGTRLRHRGGHRLGRTRALAADRGRPVRQQPRGRYPRLILRLPATRPPRCPPASGGAARQPRRSRRALLRVEPLPLPRSRRERSRPDGARRRLRDVSASGHAGVGPRHARACAGELSA